MSDPVSRTDIEDVLSSIRRLVADEPAAAAHSTSAKPGKLVLTPALRVAASGDDADSGFDEAAGQDAEASAGSGTQADSAPDAPQYDSWEDVSLEDRIADLEAAVAGSGEEWEPDGSEIARHNVTFEPSELSATQTQNTSTSHESAANAETGAGTDPAADEKAIPDDGGDDTPEGSLFDAPDPDVLDEAMLRELVSDIVREELQGALGERITRNVRKLVRREINRALASRDFD